MIYKEQAYMTGRYLVIKFLKLCLGRKIKRKKTKNRYYFNRHKKMTKRKN